MRHHRASAVSCALIVAFVVALTAGATSSEVAVLKGEYPNLTKADDQYCDFCHTSAPDFNAFGQAYMDNGASAAALQAIADDDSDGDGATNDDELSAGYNPGDASDTPPGGGDRATVSTVATDSTEVVAIDAAEDTKTGQALIAMARQQASARGAEAAANVTTQIVDDEGGLVKGDLDVGVAAVSSYRDLFAAYVNKRYLVGYFAQAEHGTLMGQIIKAKKNKAKGKEFEIAADVLDPVATSNGKDYWLAMAMDTGVEFYDVTTKGKVSRTAAPFPMELTEEFDDPMAVAYPHPDENAVVLGGIGDVHTRKLALASVVVDPDDDSIVQVNDGLSKNSKGKTLRGDVTYSPYIDEEAGTAGLAAWVIKTKGYMAMIAADGSVEVAPEKASKIKAAKKAGAIGVAPQTDGTFLIAFTDTKTEAVWGIDVDADGSLGDPFQISGDGEVVDTDLLDVTTLGDNVLVTYVEIDGTDYNVKVAIVAPAS